MPIISTASTNTGTMTMAMGKKKMAIRSNILHSPVCVGPAPLRVHVFIIHELVLMSTLILIISDGNLAALRQQALCLTPAEPVKVL